MLRNRLFTTSKGNHMDQFLTKLVFSIVGTELNPVLADVIGLVRTSNVEDVWSSSPRCTELEAIHRNLIRESK